MDDPTIENYRNALLEVRSVLQTVPFAAPEMIGMHMNRIAEALLSVGIDPHG